MAGTSPMQAIVESHSLRHAKTRGRTIVAVNRAEATMDAIRSYIMTEQLKPGDPLPTEANMCTELGVSRSSVREALRKLEALDIVEVKQGRGAFVGRMSLEPMVDTLVLRSSLEHGSSQESLLDVVRLRRYLDLGLTDDVVAALQGARHEDLHRTVADMEAKANAGLTFFDEDMAFHSSILRHTSGELVQQLTSSLWLVHMSVVPNLGPPRNNGLIRTAASHGDMLRAAEDGNAEAYRLAVHDHYEPLITLIGQYGTQHPDPQHAEEHDAGES